MCIYTMKWVFITGCDSGFGSIMVDKIIAMRGVGVFAGCYLPETVDKYNGMGREDLYAIRVDVTDESSVENAALLVKDRLGVEDLHGIVNNAGILINPGPTEWTPVEDYKRMFNVNVLGTVAVTKAFLPMIRKSKGRIVNVASIAGRIGLPSQPSGKRPARFVNPSLTPRLGNGGGGLLPGLLQLVVYFLWGLLKTPYSTYKHFMGERCMAAQYIYLKGSTV